MRASSRGLATPGKGSSSTASIQLNTVVFTAMPTASVRTAMAVNHGLRRRIRNPNHTSFIKLGMTHYERQLDYQSKSFQAWSIDVPAVRLWEERFGIDV